MASKKIIAIGVAMMALPLVLFPSVGKQIASLGSWTIYALVVVAVVGVIVFYYGLYRGSNWDKEEVQTFLISGWWYLQLFRRYKRRGRETRGRRLGRQLADEKYEREKKESRHKG